MSPTNDSNDSNMFVTMNNRKLLSIILVGVIAGLLTWVLANVLDLYVYKAFLCSDTSAVQCASSSQYATTTAMVVGAAAALFGLVRLRVFRPLLVVIAAFVSLWGLFELIATLPGYVEAVISAGMYGVALGVFAWLARIRNFFIAIILIIIMVIALRLILSA